MKNKKKKFGSLKAVLLLMQQLQAKYLGTSIEINIYVLDTYAFGAWVDGENTRIFYADDTAEERESKYNVLLTYINKRL